MEHLMTEMQQGVLDPDFAAGVLGHFAVDGLVGVVLAEETAVAVGAALEEEEEQETAVAVGECLQRPQKISAVGEQGAPQVQERDGCCGGDQDHKYAAVSHGAREH